jgi:hypothetical protein
MAVNKNDVLLPDAELNLVNELAQTVLRQVAPEELALYHETAEFCFRNPGFMQKAKPKEEAVGFGLDMAMLTPYVLAAAFEAVRFLATAISDAARDELRDELRPVIADAVRRLFRRESTPAAGDPASAQEDSKGKAVLTAEEGREVRRIALQRAKQSGLDDERASLLADALVGALLVNE